MHCFRVLRCSHCEGVFYCSPSTPLSSSPFFRPSRAHSPVRSFARSFVVLAGPLFSRSNDGAPGPNRSLVYAAEKRARKEKRRVGGWKQLIYMPPTSSSAPSTQNFTPKKNRFALSFFSRRKGKESSSSPLSTCTRIVFSSALLGLHANSPA